MKKIEWPAGTKGLLLLLLLLFVTAAFLLKEDPVRIPVTEEAWEPAAAGTDRQGETSLLTAEQEGCLWEEALEAARTCSDFYKDLESFRKEGADTRTVSLTRDQQEEAAVRLGESGLVSVAKNCNMENYEKVEAFYTAYTEGQDAQTTIFSVNQDASLSALTFVHRGGKIQAYIAGIRWQEDGTPQIEGTGIHDLEELKLTEKGYLIYKNKETAAHGNLREYYRVKPLPGECRRLTEKYISGLSYVDYNMLVTDWDSGNVEDILMPCMYEDLCRIYTGENGKPERGRIPADIYEQVMTACLPVTPEQLRQSCGYEESGDTYPYEKILPGQYPPFGEVVDYSQNEDGTLTLIVDGIWPDYNSDYAFQNRLLVQPQSDGTFRYLSNSIEKKELDIPVIPSGRGIS